MVSDVCWISVEKMQKNVVKKVLRWGDWTLWTVRKSGSEDQENRLMQFRDDWTHGCREPSLVGRRAR